MVRGVQGETLWRFGDGDRSMMIETRSESVHSGDSLPRIGGRFAIAAIFMLVSVLPVLLACFFLTSSTAGFGRVGLILPALVLAEDTSRMVLWRGLLGAGLATALALLIGLLLGHVAAQVKHGWAKLLLAIVMLPGRCPVWVFPVGWAVLLPVKREFLILLEMPLVVWVGWVGWWGGLQLADAVRLRALQICQAEWDAAILTGAGRWRVVRMVLKPRLLGDLRHTLRKVVGIALFDPTPVLFLGLSRWPIGRFIASFRELGMPGPAMAAAWAFWMLAVLAGWYGLIQWLTRSRHQLDAAEAAMPSAVVQQASTRKQLTWMDLSLLTAGLWPWLGLVAGGKLILDQPMQGMIERIQPELVGDDGIIWLGGVLVGLFIGLILSLVLRSIGRTIRLRLGRFSAEWPIGLAAMGLALLGQLRGVSGTSHMLGFLASPVLVGLIWPAVLGLLAVGRAGGLPAARPAKSGVNETKAAFEAAILAGLPASRARRMAGQVGFWALDMEAILALFQGYWWVWASPAWGMVGIWGMGVGTTWGGVLVARAENRSDYLAVYWIITVLPVALARLFQLLLRRRQAE